MKRCGKQDCFCDGIDVYLFFQIKHLDDDLAFAKKELKQLTAIISSGHSGSVTFHSRKKSEVDGEVEEQLVVEKETVSVDQANKKLESAEKKVERLSTRLATLKSQRLTKVVNSIGSTV